VCCGIGSSAGGCDGILVACRRSCGGRSRPPSPRCFNVSMTRRGGRSSRRSPMPSSTPITGSSGRALPVSAGCNDPLAALNPHAGTRVYVEVADLNETLRQVRALGGRVERGRTALGGGDRWFTTALDPTGVSFGMWTARAAMATLPTTTDDPHHRTAHNMSRSPPPRAIVWGTTDPRQTSHVLNRHLLLRVTGLYRGGAARPGRRGPG
jgi:hypothetical protein